MGLPQIVHKKTGKSPGIIPIDFYFIGRTLGNVGVGPANAGSRKTFFCAFDAIKNKVQCLQVCRGGVAQVVRATVS